MELADRGKPSRRRRSRKSLSRQAFEIIPHIERPGFCDIAISRSEEGREIFQISRISVERVARSASLGTQHFKEGVDVMPSAFFGRDRVVGHGTYPGAA